MPGIFRIRFLVMAFTVCWSARQPLSAQETIWGLSPGNTFTIETTIERQTTMQINGGREATSKVTEQLQMEYVVNSIRPTGIVFEVNVVKANRSGSKEPEVTESSPNDQLESLKNFSAFILVAPDGVVTNIARRLDSLRLLAGPEPLGMDLLATACSEKVMISWLSYPFWMTPTTEKPEQGTEWQRADELSLGLMGSLRTMVTCTVDMVDGQRIDLKISGDGRHVAEVTNDKSENLLQFANVEAAVESFSGAGQMVLPEVSVIKPEDGEPEELRPWFENLTLEWQIKGKATVTSASSEREVSFRQTRKQTSRLLPGYRVGTRRMFPVEELLLDQPR